MANEEHLKILKQGVEQWNKWRLENAIRPDLGAADLSNANLSNANLSDANLTGAKLISANLRSASMSRASLVDADLSQAELQLSYFIDADLRGASFHQSMLMRTSFDKSKLDGASFDGADAREVGFWGASLVKVSFVRTNLMRADFTGANLAGATLVDSNLSYAILVDTNLQGAEVSGSSIYGLSVWNMQGTPKDQTNLIITRANEPAVMVDDLEVAQFIYLLLNNTKIRNVIDTIGRKGVLILGRFTAERKQVLDALRNELRRLGYLPMVFDFDRPTDRDFTETIMTLAGMSLFVIADITNPKSSPLELQATVPNYMIPFVPIIHEGEAPFAMFKDLQNKFDWVLDTLEYDSESTLVQVLDKAVIRPALEKHEELMVRKLEERQTKKAKDYL